MKLLFTDFADLNSITVPLSELFQSFPDTDFGREAII